MKTVHVDASRQYDVFIENGLLDRIGCELRSLTGAKTAAVLSDDHVFPLYGLRIIQTLEQAGFLVRSFVVPFGERSKSLSTYGEVLRFLADNHVTRSDMLLALGGGVVGDLGGFAAATYLRGIDYVQVPTTLLAMVDSSVGGKTAVNLESGKNQVGCFYQPRAVFCDPETLSTLPQDQFECGSAEVIKYAVLGNASFFEELRKKPISEQIEHVIQICVEMKRDLVHQDEYDRGLRQLLNLGHSFGHAVEACSRFRVLHGQAVAIGMAIMARAACRKGFCTDQTANKIVEILKQYNLPTETEYPLDDMFASVGADKKLSADTMHLVVPIDIGKCSIEAVPLENVKEWMRLGGVK